PRRATASAFHVTPTTSFSPLPLHDALPIFEIQNHPIFDDTPARLAALAARAPGDPHPFVMGAQRYQRFWRIVSECMQADIVRKRSEEHTSELQSRENLVCRLLLEKKNMRMI